MPGIPSETDQSKPYIFISYSHRNTEIAAKASLILCDFYFFTSILPSGYIFEPAREKKRFVQEPVPVTHVTP